MGSIAQAARTLLDRETMSNDPFSSTSDYGTPPHVEADSPTEPIEGTKFAINSPTQALAVAYRMKEDWKKGIKNQAAITAQLNGQRPRDPAVLTNLGRNWLPNINTGVLRVEAGKVPARLWQPINTATYLTAARLPSNWPQGTKKTGIFQSKITKTIRSWRKWPWFMRQLAREVGFFGFGFAVWFDEYDWIPTFVRQDRGFVPAGFEILEDELPLFMVAYDYQPFELIELVEEQTKAGTGLWDKDAVAAAINSAGPKAADGNSENARAYEEMVRNASIGWTYEKAYNKISTYHLFSTDADGSVTHQIVLANDLANYGRQQTNNQNASMTDGTKFLFEKRGQFEKMSDVVSVMMFDPDDGTIHGSWGAGQMLFDLSIESEKTINDWMASMKQAAKIKAQTGDGKNPDEVRLDVDDAMMLLTNGVYAGNTAAVSTDPRPFQALFEGQSQMAREKIGSYIPPIPLQSTDIKAAQINAKQAEQNEVKEQLFQTWLWQFACLVENIVKRLCKEDTTDEVAKKLRKELLEDLNDEELEMLVNQNQIETIFDFTQVARLRRAEFAASKEGNPFYNQKTLQEIQSEAVGGGSFMEQVLVPGDDSTVELGARRDQMKETTTILVQNISVPVLPDDLDWYHMLELRPVLTQQLEAGMLQVATIMLNHYKSHYIAGVNKQAIPKEKINVEKAYVAKVAKTLETGQMPNQGFEDKIDIMDEAQSQMGSPTLRGPTEREVDPIAEANMIPEEVA